MTTSKSNKTLIGLPSDLQAVLQKLSAQEQEQERARAQHAAAHAPLQHDLSRTQYGNPHADGAASGAGQKHHGPPPLPSMQAFQPPPGYAPPAFPNQAPGARPAGSLQRTLIGMVPAEPPTHQAGWSADAAAQQATAHAVVSQALSNLPNLGRHEPSVVVSGLEAGHSAGAFDPSRTSALSSADATRGEGFGLSLSSTGELHAAEAAPALPASERPRLSLSRERTTTAPMRARRRFVPFALAAAALVSIIGVAVWRLPRILENLRAPSAAEADSVPRTAAAATTPAAPVTTALSAATDAVPAALEQDIPKAERGPVPPAVDGATAELERQAIELLVAKDYPAAARVYERLRVAEPSHREYAVMIDVLARPACGQPGQAACAAQ